MIFQTLSSFLGSMFIHHSIADERLLLIFMKLYNPGYNHNNNFTVSNANSRIDMATQAGKRQFRKPILQSCQGTKGRWISRIGEESESEGPVSHWQMDAVPTLIFAIADVTYRCSTGLRAAVATRLPGLNTDPTLKRYVTLASEQFNLVVFSFLICKAGITIAPTLDECCEG